MTPMVPTYEFMGSYMGWCPLCLSFTAEVIVESVEIDGHPVCLDVVAHCEVCNGTWWP